MMLTSALATKQPRQRQHLHALGRMVDDDETFHPTIWPTGARFAVRKGPLE
jgi:hypothetical protein